MQSSVWAAPDGGGGDVWIAFPASDMVRAGHCVVLKEQERRAKVLNNKGEEALCLTQ